MCLRMFIPTPRRLVLFLVFALAPLSGALDILLPLKTFFGLPFTVMQHNNYTTVVQIVYSYFLACIYAAAYVSIERSLRKSYPHMNDIVDKKRAAKKGRAKHHVKKPKKKR